MKLIVFIFAFYVERGNCSDAIQSGKLQVQFSQRHKSYANTSTRMIENFV